MIEKDQLKKDGLAFGRSLQKAFKLALLYAPDHPATEQSVQESYAALNAILKQSPQFGFGFYNGRVALNDLLTPDPALESLEADFFKRSVAGVSFSLGITLRDFKRGIGILATKPEEIKKSGGIVAFLQKNQTEGMHILAEAKRPSSTGDSVLGIDFQSYVTAQTILQTEQKTHSPSLELLLQTAGIASPEGFRGTAGEVLDLVGTATRTAWANPQGDPRQAIQTVARLLEDLSPSFLISVLPSPRQAELQGRPAQEIASELAEDMAVEWAKKRLSSAAEGQPGAILVEEEVLRVLARALQTTQVADRLLQKLARLVETGDLPVEITYQIRREMLWASSTLVEKQGRLMALKRFAAQDFRHLLEFVKEAGQEGSMDKATQVAEHYLACLDSKPDDVRAEGLARLPELILVLSGLQTPEFIRTLADRFCTELAEQTLPQGQSHHQVALCLATAAQCRGRFEDFETVSKLGSELVGSLARDRERHAACCGSALKNLLAPASVERLIELSVQKRPEVKIPSRTLASVLKLVEEQAGETVFRLLEDEKSASARSRLLHIARQLSQGAFQAARKRLQDERWYVMRNACYILGALGDPELATQLGPALRHSDARVQEAAITAIARSKVAGRAEALVNALPTLQPHLQETALSELLLLKDPAAIAPLEEFLLAGTTSKVGILEKALQALIAIPEERTVAVLGKILLGAANPLPLRKAALAALKASPFPSARQRLAEFSPQAPGDPLAKL